MSELSATAQNGATSETGTNKEGKRLNITHVDAFGPYLRISGQLNADAMAAVRNKIQLLLPTCFAIDPTWPVTRQQAPLHIGNLCLYKRSKGAAPADNEFVRVRILNVNTKTSQNAAPGQQPLVQVEVEFIDYGGIALVASYELLFPQQQEVLLSMPVMCTSYILLGICKDFKPNELEEISHIILRQTLDITIESEFKNFKFITMKWKEFNFAEFLIHQKKIGVPITNDLLRDNFAKFLRQQTQKQQQSLSSQQQQIQQLPKQQQQPQQLLKQQQPQPQTQNQQQPFYSTGGFVNNNNYYSINHNNNVTSNSGICPTSRSLASRLQQYQLPQQLSPHISMPAHVIVSPIQPRMPHTIGNLRSMMQGIHMQNNRIPYTGPNYQPGAFNGTTNLILTSGAAIPFTNATYNTRYQRPQPPQPQPMLITANNTRTLPQTSPRRATTATFKTNNLTVGKTYDVYVSFVENGPCLFSVQLAANQDDLTNMMNSIERVQLQQFSDKPILGTACIARYSEDGQLYRALITGVQTTACKVVYIDYGNAELVKYRDLYEIPDEFLESKAFAIRFTLSGHKELEPIDESLKKAFKDLMMYKNCKLKVMPLEGPPLVQYCELYLQESNVLDVLKEIQKCRLVYPKSEVLHNNDTVEIRYIDSPKHFYVQKTSNISKFEELMDDMFLYYNKNQVVPNHLALGAPCIVKYENEWYRAEVMRADSTAIVVRHVDFGYEQKVTKNLLSIIAEKHLKLSRQAVQCCLKGFENNELNKDLATNMFEMLAEESNRERRSFTVKVFRIQPDGVHLVNLCTKELNVMKKLYKLSMPFEQYLSLEKEEFNMHSHNGHRNQSRQTAGQENGNKTPSIASSNDISSLHSNKKNTQILNSTTLQGEERSHQKQHGAKKTPPRSVNIKGEGSITNSNQGSVSLESDKHSSASSIDNRDSRSSSNEIKHHSKRQQNSNNQQQQGRHNRNAPQQQQQQMNLLNVSLGKESDRRSVASTGSNASSYNHKTRGGGHQIPPRLQNDQRRQNKQQQQTPPQQQRSQNAPQGYSQRKQKGSSASSNRSTDVNSDATSNVSEQQQVPEEYVPLSQPIPVQHIDTPSREEVIICWWISPHQFYTHLKCRIPEFEQLMRDMQDFYKKKTLQQLQLKVGSYVVARYRKENLLYRARIIACNQMLRKYKVHFVDFGNQYTVTSEDIWQLEKRFSGFPCMAYLCSFSGIVSNYDHLYIIDRMEKYLPAGAALKCEYVEREEEMYYVNVKLNGVSLKDTLKSEGIISEVVPELRLSLLAGQQIRAKITFVKDMLNFKIQIDGLSENIQLLSSYDDIRYVKSNPDIAVKFKQVYEGKSSVVNIKDVNDNKVILLRPLLPLLKDDIPTYICQRPIILEKFDVRVVYVGKAYRLYVQMIATDPEMIELLNDMFEHFENNGTLLEKFECEQICAAKGKDGNWYRARIINVSNGQDGKKVIEVYYIDYGNTEKLTKSNLKTLDERFYLNRNAYAIELNLPIRALGGDTHHKSKARKTQDETDAAVITKLKEATLVNEPVLILKAIEVRNNHLIGDLYLENGESIVDNLQKMNLIKCRDVDYMRKFLDKDKSNMFEYIELVDLTLEDEDDTEKKHMSKNKNSSSPRKKKTAAKNEEKIDKAANNLSKPVVVTEPIEIVKEAEKEKLKKEAIVPVVTQESIPQPVETIKELRASTPIDPPVSSTVQQPLSEPQSVAESETESVDPYADMEHAILSHCDNPGQFFVHPYEKLDELRKLQENLQIVASSLPPLMRVINGAPCISLYSVDKQWYRAKIIDAELMVLQFIDYGNTDCVSDTTDVKEMIVFPDTEPLCMPCSLPIKPNGTADWVDAANAIFNDSYSKLLNFEYITRGDIHKRSFINLYIDGVNIADRLVEDGFAKPLELVISGENCYISHVNNITDFYIQYEKDSKALELIEIYLADNQKLPKIEKFEHSKIVAALFPDDEMWYRAKLLKEITGKGYEVLFIDYGNTSISPECREISEEIAKLPSLSKKCALELPQHCLAWSDAAEEKFAEIAAQGETIFTVNLCEPAANHALVHLLIDGHNINDDLEPLCEHKPIEVEVIESLNTTLQSSVFESGKLYDAIISHANSPSDFYVQFSNDTVRLEDMTNSLNTLGMDVVKEPRVGQVCAAVYNQDNALYRARIISIEKDQYNVSFIDFGNEAVTNDLRVLPHDLEELPGFCKRCQLVGATEEFGAAVAKQAFTQLIDECEGFVKVEFTEKDSIPALVKLYTTNCGEDIGEKLHALITRLSANSSAMASTQQTTTCLISHAISPLHFYIQPKTNSLNMEQVTKALSKGNAEKLELLTCVEVGVVCSVYCTEDDSYYRGRVQCVLAGNSGYEIFLLDYGNTITTTEVRELPPELCAIPALAWKCKLNEVPAAPDALLEERFATLLEAHFGEMYEIESDEITEDSDGERIHTVKLQVNYKDLSDELTQAVSKGDGADTDDVLPVPKLHNCNIIHVNSPGSFYIQLDEDIPEVERITDVLLDAETQFQQFPISELQTGALCAAQFPEDMAFYRAVIVQVLEDGKCEVHYLDFGNNAITDQFRKLPENMLNVEGYSKHCALDVNFCDNTEAIAKFSTLIDSRFSETFQVEFLKTTVEPRICRLFFQDKNVANEVTQLIKDDNSIATTNGIEDSGVAWTDKNISNDAKTDLPIAE